MPRGIKVRYKGLSPLDTQHLNHKFFGCLHKQRGNCMNYTPGFLHDIDYTKMYNSCYFIPTIHRTGNEVMDESSIEKLKEGIKEAIGIFCFDLTVEEFELPEDEHFSKYNFKNGYNYWKDYTKDLKRVFKCKAKYRVGME